MVNPDAVRAVGTSELLIVWDDGSRRLYPFTSLRFHCPCAGCIDEMTGERRIRPEQVRPDVHPLDWKTVGNYALQIRWSDGHQTGIYSYDYLHQLKV